MPIRSGDNVYRMRVDVIYRMIACGSKRAEILAFTAKTWGIGDRSTDTIIRKARDLLAKELEKSREECFANELALRDEIVRACMQSKQYQTALNAAEARAKLCGLYCTLDTALKVTLAAGFIVTDPRTIRTPSGATGIDAGVLASLEGCDLKSRPFGNHWLPNSQRLCTWPKKSYPTPWAAHPSKPLLAVEPRCPHFRTHKSRLCRSAAAFATIPTIQVQSYQKLMTIQTQRQFSDYQYADIPSEEAAQLLADEIQWRVQQAGENGSSLTFAEALQRIRDERPTVRRLFAEAPEFFSYEAMPSDTAEWLASEIASKRQEYFAANNRELSYSRALQEVRNASRVANDLLSEDFNT